MVHDLTRHQNCFELLISRTRFLNCYIFSKWTYHMQIFPIAGKTIANTNKFTGYFVWRNHILPTVRTNLVLTHSEDGLSLKHITTRGVVLLLHRTLSMIWSENSSFAQQTLMSVLRDISTGLPLNIANWSKKYHT